MPHTPHTPGAASHPMTPGGPPSVSSSHNEPISGGTPNANGSGSATNGSGNNNSSTGHNSPQTPGTPSRMGGGMGGSGSADSQQQQQEQLLNSLMSSQTQLKFSESDLSAELQSFDAAAAAINDTAHDLNVSIKLTPLNNGKNINLRIFEIIFSCCKMWIPWRFCPIWILSPILTRRPRVAAATTTPATTCWPRYSTRPKIGKGRSWERVGELKWQNTINCI